MLQLSRSPGPCQPMVCTSRVVQRIAVHIPRGSNQRLSKVVHNVKKCQKMSKKKQQKSTKCRPICVKNLYQSHCMSSCVYNSGRLQSLQATQATQATTTSVHYDLKAMAQGWTQGWLNQTLVKWKHSSRALKSARR